MGSSRHLVRISSTRRKSCDLVTCDLDVLHGSACQSAQLAAGVKVHFIEEDHHGYNPRSSASRRCHSPSSTIQHQCQKSITFYEALDFTPSASGGKIRGRLPGVMMRSVKTEIGLSPVAWKKGRDQKRGSA